MKALNNKERSSAIFRFSLWLLLCVAIICVPIIISGYISSEKRNVESGETEDLMKEATFEKEYLSVQIDEIMGLLESRDAEELDAETFGAELVNILNDIQDSVAGDISWRGDMYRNITDISRKLIMANKVMSTSGEGKDKQIADLNEVLLEFEACAEDLADLNDERKKKDIHKGVDEVEEELQKAIKMLRNYKAGLK